jgi:hypothetical protein
MLKLSSDKAFNLITLILATALFVYVLLRSYFLSITHDECLTLTIVLGDTWRAGTANNHLLNTWLLFGITPIFGTAEAVLRAPNVLSFILYAYFSWRIVRMKPSLILRLFGISLLFLNPYMLDFFSLSRGYGLSLAFMMPALYYFLEGENSRRSFISRFQLSLLFITLSLLANLNALNISLAIILLYLLEYYLRFRRGALALHGRQWWQVILPIAAYLIILVNLWFRIRKMSNRNELYYGGNIDFYSDTITRLVQDWLYDATYGTALWVALRFAMVLVFIFAIGLVAYRRELGKIGKITLLLGLIILASILQFILFGSLLPVHRTALQFYPLIALMLFFLLVEIEKLVGTSKGLRIGTGTIAMVVIALLLFHAANNLNFRKVNEWRYEANTRPVMKWIQEYRREHGTALLQISHQWDLEPALNYYRHRYGMEDLPAFNRDGIRIGSDFIYCSRENAVDAMNSGLYAVVIDDPVSGTLLLKKSGLP